MDDLATISTFTKALTSFCNHLQTSSDALKQSMDRRPIPLDSASSTFISSLNRRVSTASKDLNLLESMAFGTVSFEELLGHCNELFSKNQSDLIQIEDRFKQFGYVPADEIDKQFEAGEEDVDVLGLNTPDSKFIGAKDGMDLPSVSRSSIMKRLQEDPLMNESLSLKYLGISDVCLATLTSQSDSRMANLRNSPKLADYDSVRPFGTEAEYPPATKSLGATQESSENKLAGSSAAAINISKDEYENLPSFMKILASWEELSEAVDKMNSILCNQRNSKEGNFFHPDKLSSLGPKVRSYLLMLVRMHQLVVETVDGSMVYRAS